MEKSAGSLSLVTMKNVKTFPEPHFEDFPKYPEQRLWAAVVLQALNDFETLLQRIESTWNGTGRAVNRQYRIDAEELVRHMNHTLFRAICDHANVAHTLVLRSIERMKREYCFNVIPYDDSAISSSWKYARTGARHRKLK